MENGTAPIADSAGSSEASRSQRKPAKRENERTVAGGHRMMRRADREVTDPEQIEGIIAA